MAVFEQGYTNSCGAAALLCAAVELEVDEIPQSQRYSLWQDGAIPLALNDECEDRLYQVTSHHPNDEDPLSWGYSMPSGIVECARLLGLAARVIAEPTWSVRLLKMVHSAEMAELQRIAAMGDPLSQCFFGNRSRMRPEGAERELRVLLSWKWETLGQMHYVMVRPNGEVMEPGDGRNHDHMQDVKADVAMHGTGLSIFIRRA